MILNQPPSKRGLSRLLLTYALPLLEVLTHELNALCDLAALHFRGFKILRYSLPNLLPSPLVNQDQCSYEAAHHGIQYELFLT